MTAIHREDSISSVRLLRALILALLCCMSVWSARAVTVSQQANQLLINGKPTPLLFSLDGPTVQDLPAYHALGFNTLLVQVDSPGPDALARADTLIAAAEHEGLYVLVELTAGDWASGRHACVTDTTYLEDAGAFLDAAIPHLSAHPNLVGWVIGTVREGNLISEVGSFREFLRGKYHAVDNLDNAWSTQIISGDTTQTLTSQMPSFELITDANALKLANHDPAVQKIVQSDLDDYHQLVIKRDADFQQYLRTRYQTIGQINQSWDFQFASWESIHVDTLLHRFTSTTAVPPIARMELARYESLVPRMLFDWWAKQIASRDAVHLLFAGEQHSYRTIINLPTSVNGALVECYPGIVEVDPEDHDPHAFDIARRGNRFIVLAGLATDNVDAAHLTQYLYEAALHGAAGIAVSNGSRLASSGELTGALQADLADITQRRLLNRTPAPHIAIVYSSYALGHPEGQKQPLYGYMRGLFHFGPDLLFLALREGTCFGQVDYLAAEDLSAVPLNRYQTIILPTVFDIPYESQVALMSFAQQGGIVLADIGAGSYQLNGDGVTLPDKLQQLFGVQAFPPISDTRLNMQVNQPDSRFPSLLTGVRTTGTANGYMIMRSAKAVPYDPMAQLLFTTVANAKIVPPSKPSRPAPLKRALACGMFIVPREQGTALFAPFPLYQCWMPGFMLFDEFHHDLFALGANIAMEEPDDFLPKFAEVARYADGSVDAWMKNRGQLVVHVHPLPAADGKDQAGQLLNVTPDEGQCDIEPTGATLRYATSGLHCANPLPIYLLGAPAFSLCTTVGQYDASGIMLNLGADDEHAQQPITLRVGDGRYAVAPSSRHLVQITTEHGTATQTITADAGGQCIISAPNARCRIFITNALTPASMPSPPTEQGDQFLEATPLQGSTTH